jgi:hypothetical protein
MELLTVDSNGVVCVWGTSDLKLEQPDRSVAAEPNQKRISSNQLEPARTDP